MIRAPSFTWREPSHPAQTVRAVAGLEVPPPSTIDLVGMTLIEVDEGRVVTNGFGEVSAEGKIVHGGNRSALAEARVVDAKGRLCAPANRTCAIFDRPPFYASS